MRAMTDRTQQSSPRDSGKNAPADGIAARLRAFDVLDLVLEQGKPLDEAFDAAQRGKTGKQGPQSDRDSAHARMMVLTVLRRLGQIDAVLNRFLTRKPSGKGGAAMTLLRLGAGQILFMETPPHAAGSTALAVADKRNLAGFKGLVNAVLRKVAAAAPSVQTQDAARMNMPDWLWKACDDAYGISTAREIGAAHLVEAPLDLTVKDGDASAWAERLGGAVLPTRSVRLWNAGDVRKLAGYRDGAWWVQDAAAALPVKLLISALGENESAFGSDGAPPTHVGDLCAAPGGKTAQLAAAGLKVTAVDVSAARLVRVRENLDRLSLNAEIVEADALTWRPSKGLLDGVLLDAPCSATGTVRRHPDLPWVKGGLTGTWNRDELTTLQKSMLLHSVSLVKPGAPVVYATCSLLPEEGESVVTAALAEDSTLLADPIRPEEMTFLPEALREDGTVRTFPSFWQQKSGNRRGGMDGFFVARFRRRA